MQGLSVCFSSHPSRIPHLNVAYHFSEEADLVESMFMRPSYENREGKGTPLQYSRPENPMDGGAWWAAVCGVAQSRTRL